MKILRVFTLAALFSFGMAACNQDEGTENTDLEETQEVPEIDPNATEEEDEGNRIGIDVKADEEGNVEGEMEGEIDLDRK